MKNERILLLMLILTGINFGYGQQTLGQNCSGDYPTYYTTMLVYLYQEQDSESAIIGEVPKGNAVKVKSSYLGSVTGFWSICYKGKSGFAKKSQLSYKKVSSTKIESSSSINSDNTSSNQDVGYYQKRKEQEAKKAELDKLMGGLDKSDGSASGSEGDDNSPGDKGQPDGDPYATSYYGSPGSGSGTGGYGLNGRSLVSKAKVQQKCNQEGRIVVKIVVDRNGIVISATPGVKGTTNNNPCLLEPAKKTAFMHKWNLDSNAPNQQIGFVAVNYKLGE